MIIMLSHHDLYLFRSFCTHTHTHTHTRQPGHVVLISYSIFRKGIVISVSLMVKIISVDLRTTLDYSYHIHGLPENLVIKNIRGIARFVYYFMNHLFMHVVSRPPYGMIIPVYLPPKHPPGFLHKHKIKKGKLSVLLLPVISIVDKSVEKVS